MGIYINPGNESFRVKRNDTYIDKSGLIGVVNQTIGKRNKLSCISYDKDDPENKHTCIIESWNG